MTQDWKIKEKAKRREMMKDLRLVRFMVNFSMIATTINAVNYAAYRVQLNLTQAPETSHNSLYTVIHNSSSRISYVSSKFFFDVQSSPTFEIIWVGQVACGLLISMVYPDGFFFVVIYHVSAQLDILRLDIRKLVVASKELTFAEAIKPIIRRQLELKRWKV